MRWRRVLAGKISGTVAAKLPPHPGSQIALVLAVRFADAEDPNN